MASVVKTPPDGGEKEMTETIYDETEITLTSLARNNQPKGK